MDFAKKQLEKYGWKEGKGLGKNEDGIADALKPKLKFDNSGIGHNVGDQFTNNWWERLFNSASSNINVQVANDEVKLELHTSESVEISTKNYSIKELKKNKNLQYGSFLKTAKLTENGIQNFNVAPPEPIACLSRLSDEELFAACGGRTAHKGARHGLKLSGKLSRIEKQEKMLLKKMKNVSLSDDDGNIEKKLKKLKKQKEDNCNAAIVESDTNCNKKKNKKKRKSVTFNKETEVKYYTPDLDTSHESSSNIEENNSDPLVDTNSNGSDEGIEQDIEDNNNEQDGSHRSFEELQKNFSDLSKAERKKLKKKRKLDKKTATEKFIEEVKEEMYVDDKCKKRKLAVDLEFQQNQCLESSKKKKMPDKSSKKKHKQRKREKKIMNSIAKSLDNFCRISDDE